MIERICKRYYEMNNKDYADGRIDRKVKDDCDNSVKGFAQILEKLGNNNLSSFYYMSRNVQEKVFAYDSVCSVAATSPRDFINRTLAVVKKDLVKTGLNNVSCVRAIMSFHINWLEKLLNADYVEGDGWCGYIGINK